ncbi:hypothetical protein LTS08_003700 [Lithohypha guttulata]|uniref:Uncharacterized protein n=1 Tax=Lithohypha guttulata TaxID=1690604 RepID=A0AAN7YF68_9EURO|nr:hypothetical protein LTR51_001345 [Lithohypha guttulata]KAK5083507.1 hypothetical protein LTR05_006009 [Lithohypha guttulata]KAK5102898.1 hypothetical protein LTS08_003700 [Lithohypha guttulata]
MVPAAAYERLISSNNLILLSQICFPWDIVLLAINQDNLQYNFTAAAEALWSKMVGIPADCESCIHLDLTMSGAAFTSTEDEILELVVRQTEMTREIQQNLWLRSPALRGTIQRALVRYAQKVAISQAETIFGTQQIPVVSFDGEARSMNDLELDLVAQLVLSTHRAYHSAWKAFAHIHNIHNSNEVPPPAYEKVDTGGLTGKRPDSNTEASMCYCWICERVADEVQDSADNISPLMRTLSLVSSSEEMDEKRSTYSDSSSETEEICLHLKLSRRQIKAITVDIGLYRYIEAARHTRVNMAASSSP